jgi:hypothetical protein
MSGIANFFSGASPTPAPMLTPTPSPTHTSAPSPVAETTGHAGKKTARQARAASENAASASKEAAKASAAAAPASKQAASVANPIGGSGPTNADVSLESNQATTAAGVPVAAVGNRATPSSSPSTDPNLASVARTTPTLSSSAMESSGPVAVGNPAKAAKLIQDIDKIEKRVDRKNLSADDSQRDILAQKLLQEAESALAEHDSVAAMSLATKASTLLEPLPKLADTSVPSTP